MFTPSFHDVGAVSLHLASGPANGPPLVLFHGVLRCWRDFAPLWPALLPRWNLQAVDQRGHGQSGRSAGDYFVKDYAADAVSLMQQLPSCAVLFGHSLGGLVAAAVAAVLPDRVRAIILEDPPAPSFLASVDRSPWHAVWTGMQHLAGRNSISTGQLTRELAELRVPSGNGEARLGDLRDATSLRFSAHCLAHIDPAVLTPLLENRWLEGHDVEQVWRKVRCPALILRGEERLGGMLNRAEAEQMAGWMSDATIVDVAGAGHLIHWQMPEATTRLCLGFLESL